MKIRESLLVILGALLSTALIFGLLYDVFDSALRRWTDRDLNRRAHLIGVAVASGAGIADLATSEDAAHLISCSADGALLAASGIGRELGCRSPLAQAALASNGRSTRGRLGAHNVVVTAHALGNARTLFVVQDRTFLDARRKHVLQVLFVFAELVVLALLLLARAGERIGRRTGEAAARLVLAKLRPDANAGIDRLRALAASEVSTGGLVVIANREPYAHEWTEEGGVAVQRPASGLVTGIEPILRACGGTWIGYGGGSADRAHSDGSGRVAVPPEAPEYTLRRLFIEEDAYERYYSGFANEGLWPLCHMAYAQPSFRANDWTAYQSVNDMFARAAAEETSADGLLLIQDYHFALVPKLVRDLAPRIVTSLFWHIPWPNVEIAGICPWKETLLEGMLGADILGFHTRQYALNFLETAQRYLECRVDFDAMAVTHGGHRTVVRTYPISVEWPYPAASRAEGAELRRALGIPDRAHVSVGVDRADYTKGLLERVAAVELLLEENPSLAGKFVFVQLASPTRTRIPKYQQLTEDLVAAVERVNARFPKSIVLQLRTFAAEEVRQYYAMANSALVTPLHDGMNLVAKEYVAACEDADGALVLSSFAGAAKELDGALLVNPYDTAETAQAILRAIRMPLGERRARMQVMREQIASNSIYDWSKALLDDMCDIRRERARFWPQQRSARRLRKPHEGVAG